MNLLNNILNDKYKMFWLKLIILQAGIFLIIALILLGRWLTT
jgi:hypothetical protein